MTDRIDEAPDSDVFAAKKELEARIHSALVRLPTLLQNRLQSDSFWRISECMKVTENTYDFSRLPAYYRKPRSPRPKRFDCLRALATYVVVKWWDYSLDRTETPFPIAFLEKLERIIELGLDKFKVAGTHEKGFGLVECAKCSDTGLVDQTEEGDEGDEDYCTCSAGIARAEKDDECYLAGEDTEDEEKE